MQRHIKRGDLFDFLKFNWQSSRFIVRRSQCMQSNNQLANTHRVHRTLTNDTQIQSVSIQFKRFHRIEWQFSNQLTKKFVNKSPNNFQLQVSVRFVCSIIDWNEMLPLNASILTCEMAHSIQIGYRWCSSAAFRCSLIAARIVRQYSVRCNYFNVLNLLKSVWICLQSDIHTRCFVCLPLSIDISLSRE